MTYVTKSISEEEFKYVQEQVLFFSLEHLDEYVYFYRDGKNSITTQQDKLLTDLHNAFKYDDFSHVFYELKERVEKLKIRFKDLNFHYDVILTNEE